VSRRNPYADELAAARRSRDALFADWQAKQAGYERARAKVVELQAALTAAKAELQAAYDAFAPVDRALDAAELELESVQGYYNEADDSP
jgi:chromosome segregation ATPase